MAHVNNLKPWHRPPTPSLDNGPIQQRARRAFFGSGKQVLSTSEIMQWTHPRPRPVGGRHRQRQSLRRVLDRYCIRIGRAGGMGRPILWKLKDKASANCEENDG
jgi:hypothetical protein